MLSFETEDAFARGRIKNRAMAGAIQPGGEGDCAWLDVPSGLNREYFDLLTSADRRCSKERPPEFPRRVAQSFSALLRRRSSVAAEHRVPLVQLNQRSNFPIVVSHRGGDRALNLPLPDLGDGASPLIAQI